MKKILACLSSVFVTMGGMMTFSPVSYASVLVPQQLFSTVVNPFLLPCHLKGNITDSTGNIDMTLIDAYDPINREKSATVSGRVGGGGFSETITGQVIQIGDKNWARSTPPGGGWRETTVPFKPDFFPIGLLAPYVENYHQINGKLVRGHATTGVEFFVIGKGLQFIERYANSNAAVIPNIIKKAQIKLWIGPRNHLREFKLKETCVQDGHEYYVYSKDIYYDYEKPLHLTPPA